MFYYFVTILTMLLVIDFFKLIFNIGKLGHGYRELSFEYKLVALFCIIVVEVFWSTVAVLILKIVLMFYNWLF